MRQRILPGVAYSKARCPECNFRLVLDQAFCPNVLNHEPDSKQVKE